MAIDIKASFDFHLEEPTDTLLQFEAAMIPEQYVASCDTRIEKADHIARVPAQDGIGDRIWVRAQGRVQVDYTARVEVKRLMPDLATLRQLDTHDLPGEAVEYVFDSRYCAADRMQSFVHSEFGDLAGGERILAMRDWIAGHVEYAPGSSTATTDALDTFVERRGICRDFAHVMISFARASAIPARYVSAFAPGVTPQDFHAVAEVFLQDTTTPGGGAWYIVDATGMADPAETVKIGIGRDAADVSFMTTFGMAEFGDKTVEVKAVS